MTRTHRTYLVAAGVAAIVTAANASHGAYFSQSWGWVALAFLVPTTVLLILDGATAPGRLRIAFAAFMGALAVWTLLSSIWSVSAPASLREAERMLVYVAVALAVALVLRRGDGSGVLAGIVVGITLISTYALATRLFPDRLDTYDTGFGGYRLAEPLGYWNALGLLATIGLLVALGFAAHARRTGVAVVAAAATPLLALTLYFTFSRGAWAALVIGLVTAIAVDPRRFRLLWTAVVVACPSAVCVAYASQQPALTTTEDAVVGAAASEGQRAALVLGAVVVVSGLAGLGARTVAARVPVSRRTRRGFGVVLALAIAAAAILGLSHAGGPSGLQDRFSTDPTGTADLNDRLFSASGNGRAELFRVAWDAGRERPLVGNGSGTFEYLWYERRPVPLVVRDGHSLFVETFAELGAIGLGLLCGALLVLVVGALRGRRQRFVPVGLGVLCAWSAASMFDWHWEMVGVTLPALLAGSVGLLASERTSGLSLLAGTRIALIGVTGVLSVLAVWSLVGNQALFAGREALAREEWGEARAHGRRAQALLFWSNEPRFVLGDAAAGLGDRASALRLFREAVERDPNDRVAWLRLARVARGAERAAAVERVRELNPLEEGLPGE